MEQQVLNFISDLSQKNIFATYLFFFINAMLQIVFPPYPGDTITIFQGYITYSIGYNKYLMIFSTVLGSFLGSIILYYFSYKESDKVLNNKFLVKLFGIDKIHKFENWFKKYGSFFIIINKFIPGIGSLTFVAAGIFKLPKVPAIITILIANVLQNTMLFTAGIVAGDNMPLIKASIKEYSNIIIFIIAIFAAIYVYYLYKKKDRCNNF